MALQLGVIAFGPPWQVQALSLLLMGWGFYMLHGSLQVFSSELSEDRARHRDVAACVLLLHGPDRRPDRLWLRPRCTLGKLPTLLSQRP